MRLVAAPHNRRGKGEAITEARKRIDARRSASQPTGGIAIAADTMQDVSTQEI